MALATDPATAGAVDADFAEAVAGGLSGVEKSIPCRFLYDARGSALFEEITQLREYYPTRTEIGLLERHGPEIAALADTGCAVVEFGSGSSRKTNILLDHLQDVAAYVPIDISDEALEDAAARLKRRYPELPVMPVHADFNGDIDLPGEVDGAPRLGFFPGSTIGNFEHDEAAAFLEDAGELLGEDSAFLVGADLKKAEDILIPAYDDAAGVTAAFTLNLLVRINRELGGDLDVARFAHEAVWNAEKGRIEIYIVSRAGQTAMIGGRRYAFAEGERIHVENSHKFSIPQFQALARRAGWTPARVWSDARGLFSMHYLVRNGAG